jgi:molybdopterin synthase sulfur carrier subunit
MPSNRRPSGSAHVFRVAIPTQLRSYTRGAAQVDVAVDTVAPRLEDVFAALDEAYPGMRFRMIDEAGHVRPHIQVFVDMAVERDPRAALREGAQIMIVGALSGG